MQLESKGFGVLHVSYVSILSAFNELGIDASSDDGPDGTTEAQFRDKISRWEQQIQPAATNRFLQYLNTLHASQIADFAERIESSLIRRVVSVRLTVLRGHTVERHDVDSAIEYFVQEERVFGVREDAEQREAFEVHVRFNTDARIDASFANRAEAISFLRTFN